MSRTVDPRITVVSPSELSSAPERLIDLVRKQGLVLIPGEVLELRQFEDVLDRFGPILSHPLLPDDTQGSRLSVLERQSDHVGSIVYGAAWHQNLTFLDEPPDITVLHAQEISDQRNFTAYVDLAEVGAWISGGLKEFLQSVEAIHSTSAPQSPQNVFKLGDSVRTISAKPQEAVHPGWLTDPSSGLGWPFVVSNYVTALVGWTKDESAPLIKFVYDFCKWDEFVIRQHWQTGDVFLWDNRRYLHRATLTHRTGNRRLVRGDLRLGWGLR